MIEHLNLLICLVRVKHVWWFCKYVFVFCRSIAEDVNWFDAFPLRLF